MLYSILYAIILVLIAIGLFYVVYRLLKAEKDVVLELLRYIAVFFLSWIAICSIIAALRCFTPIGTSF